MDTDAHLSYNTPVSHSRNTLRYAYVNERARNSWLSDVLIPTRGLGEVLWKQRDPVDTAINHMAS